MTAIAFGNMGLMGIGEDTGEPFFGICATDEASSSALGFGTQIAVLYDRAGIEAPDSCLLSFYQDTLVHPIPGKLLPEGVPYVEQGEMVEILPECQPTFVGDDSDFIFAVESAPALVVGETYIVNWNGAEYTCMGQDASAMVAGAVLLGNGGFVGLASNDEPFVIVTMNGAMSCIAMNETTELTVSIYQDGETIHKLDNKFLDLAWLPTMEKVETEVFAETTYTSVSGNSKNLTEPIGLVAGKTYTVTFNGTEYKRTAFNHAVGGFTVVVLGDYSGQIAGFPATGEPFGIVEFDAETAAAMGTPNYRGFIAQNVSTEGRVEFTISIKEKVKAPNKLPEEFLPESVDGVTIRSSTADSTKKFKLTVDDNGTITATEV